MQELPIEGRKKERKEGKKEGGKEGRKEQRKEGGREWEKGEKATSLLYSIRFLCECVYFGLKCFLGENNYFPFWGKNSPTRRMMYSAWT